MAREVRPILWPTIARALRDPRLGPQVLDAVGVLDLHAREGAAELRDRLPLALGAQHGVGGAAAFVVGQHGDLPGRSPAASVSSYLIGGRGSIGLAGFHDVGVVERVPGRGDIGLGRVRLVVPLTKSPISAWVTPNCTSVSMFGSSSVVDLRDQGLEARA